MKVSSIEHRVSSTDGATVMDAVRVREADSADNDALLRLASSCPMQGDVGLCVDRAPEFFALNRLQGDVYRVGLAQSQEGDVMGCVAAARRHAYVQGRPAMLGYSADLKVAPEFRGSPAADELIRWAAARLHEFGGPDLPVLLTILAGNRRMERRTPGPRNLPRFTRLATIRSFSIPLLLPRFGALDSAARVQPARSDDIPEMIALWQQVAPHRQFAPVLSEESFARWLNRAHIDISAYRIARDARGSIAGFLALWDQHAIKQLRVTEYSQRLAAVRYAFNALAPMLGSRPLPEPGAPLTCITAAHICVPGTQPAVLHALLENAYAELRGQYSILNVGLDTRDPLCVALAGLLAQPTDVNAYITTPSGGRQPPELDDRPLHYEIALV